MDPIDLSLDRFAYLADIVSKFLKTDNVLEIINGALALTEIPEKDQINEVSIATTELEALIEFNESSGNSLKERVAARKAINFMIKERDLLDFREHAVDFGVSNIFNPDSFETALLIRRLAEVI